MLTILIYSLTLVWGNWNKWREPHKKALNKVPSARLVLQLLDLMKTLKVFQVCQVLLHNHQDQAELLHIGNPPIKVLLRQQLLNKHRNLRDHSGVFLDRPIHQREVISLLNTWSPLAHTVIILETNWMLIMKLCQMKIMNLRKYSYD